MKKFDSMEEFETGITGLETKERARSWDVFSLFHIDLSWELPKRTPLYCEL